MTIYVHIGVSKTGTTTIQSVLHAMSRRLGRERSLYYPEGEANHRAIAIPFLQSRPFRPVEIYRISGRGDRDDLERAGTALLRKVERAARHYRDLILSSEQIRLLDIETILGLAGFLKGLSHEVKVIVYVRHPAERVSSLACQAVRAGRSHLASFVCADDVSPAVRNYAEAFGKSNMIVRRFGAKYFAGGDLLTDFMTAIGQAPLSDIDTPRLNPTLSMAAVLLADQLPGGELAIRERRLRERYLGQIAGPPFRVTRALAEQAIAANLACLDYLEREFDLRFDADDMAGFPETLDTEFSEVTLSSMAAVLYHQNRQIEGLRVEIARLRRHDLFGLVGRRAPRLAAYLRRWLLPA